MKTRIIYLLTVGLIAFTACEKDTEQEKETSNDSRLAAIAEVEKAKGNDFLQKGERIDNTGIYDRLVVQAQDRATIWRPFPSRWGWDCIGCFGMCDVNSPYPFPWPGEPVPFPFPWPSIEHNSVGGVLDAGEEGLKLQVYPAPEECACAFTEDGFFPIEGDITMSAETCEIMELPVGTSIQEGVYLANMDAEGNYTSVTLNLITE